MGKEEEGVQVTATNIQEKYAWYHTSVVRETVRGKNGQQCQMVL